MGAFSLIVVINLLNRLAMKNLPNLCGFLEPLGFPKPPEKDGDFNIIQDIQARPLTYAFPPLALLIHHQVDYWVNVIPICGIGVTGFANLEATYILLLFISNSTASGTETTKCDH